MAKRFTDTEKWERPWFRKLPWMYRELWLYVCDKCDVAGIWYVDLEVAAFLIGSPLELEKSLGFFEKQITILEAGSKWLLKDFAPFQYGELTPNNNLHKSVMSRLSAIRVSAPQQALNSPSRGAQDKDKRKDGVEVGDGTEGVKFEMVWAKYPRREGRKEALKHFRESVKNPKDFLDLQNALENYIAQLRRDHTEPQFIKMGSTWFNNWRDYVNYAGPRLPSPTVPPIESRMSPEAREAYARLQKTT